MRRVIDRNTGEVIELPDMQSPLEQSKTPKEEQCYCLRYGSPMPLGLPLCPMHAKTPSVNGGTCNKCGEENIDIVGTHIHSCKPKTEDTGECKCHCHHTAQHFGEPGYLMQPNWAECPRNCSESCVHCNASGVSKEATNEDSCDTLSPSENKGSKEESNLQKDCFNHCPLLGCTCNDCIKCLPQSSENKEESMEDRFDEKMQHYTDGKTEFGYKGDGIKGFWLRSGMDGEIDSDKVKDFIQSEISKAVAKERSRIRRQIKNEFIDARPTITVWTTSKNRDEAEGYNKALNTVLSLLNSKKSKE